MLTFNLAGMFLKIKRENRIFLINFYKKCATVDYFKSFCKCSCFGKSIITTIWSYSNWSISFTFSWYSKKQLKKILQSILFSQTILIERNGFGSLILLNSASVIAQSIDVGVGVATVGTLWIGTDTDKPTVSASRLTVGGERATLRICFFEL